MAKKKISFADADLGDAVYNLHEYGLSPHTREIYLHSAYHYGAEEEGEPGVDYRMAATFIKNLGFLNAHNRDNILIHQNTCGGEWTYGMAIYDAIISSPSPVTILAYAHARSMSSIILQAAKKRVLMPDCEVLIHHGALYFADRYKPVVTTVEFCEKNDRPRMMDIYASRCRSGKFFKKMKTGKPTIVKFISKKLQEKTDWIMTAEDAVHYGFADGILGEKGFKDIETIRK